MMAMPEQIYSATPRASSMETLFFKANAFASNPEEIWFESGREVMGFPLPDFQRPVVWTDEQCIRFIESAWLGFHLGVFVVNREDWDDHGPKRFSGCLVDGQQRLTAVARYLQDAFPVFGARWSALSKREQRRFRRTTFASAEVDIWDEGELRDLYDRLNFGGTPHTDEQRAVKLTVNEPVNERM